VGSHITKRLLYLAEERFVAKESGGRAVFLREKQGEKEGTGSRKGESQDLADIGNQFPLSGTEGKTEPLGQTVEPRIRCRGRDQEAGNTEDARSTNLKPCENP